MADETVRKALAELGVKGAPVLGARGLVHFADVELTRPGHATLVSEMTVGGPEEGRDRRLVVDVDTLAELLAQARESGTKRVVVHGAGLRVRTYRSIRDGHSWEQWYLIGGKVEPERAIVDPTDGTLRLR